MVGEFESFGEYELHERVAIGGMAEVFRATRRGAVGFEQELAIKRILPGLGDDEFTRMFIDEAKIAVRLSHPNVAQVYDLGRVDEQLYIALEYVHGRDMRRVADRLEELNSRAALPPAIAVHVAMRVARALHAAHTVESQGRPLGIIHRDVSPQNVLLSFEGQVKVIDFGLAKAAGRLTQTQAGVVKGKLAYLSSEQARGQSIDCRSDIFSLGTCLFEWLTGERLFLGKNDLETVMNVQKANVPSLRSIDRSLPMRLDTIVMKALEPDPFMRFDTAQAMAEALERLAYEEAMILTRGALARFMGKVFPEAEQPAPLGAPQVSQAYELDDGDLELIDISNPGADPVEEVRFEQALAPSPHAPLPGFEDAVY
ncbi:MAG: serine/threonine protein kinase, partial [Deltaproteobacteria bacterium]|nr:serine/threonine protein kinase [Deltaproteobacteria bacterium]